MNCAELKEIAGALAIGACDDDERSAAEAHLREPTHDGCFEALREASAAAALLAKAEPPLALPEKLWDRIDRKTKPARWPYFAAAAAALVFLAIGLSLPTSEERHRRSFEAALQQPGSQVVELASQAAAPPSTKVQAVVNGAKKTGVVVATGLPRVKGKDYELWVIKGTQKTRAGLLQPTGKSAIIEIDPALLAQPFDALAITIEDEGGADQPAGPILYVGAIKS